MEIVICVLRFFLYLFYFILLVPIFVFLFLVGFAKVCIFCPFIFLVIGYGDAGVIVGLWPLYLFWTTYCIARSKKFGPYMKCLLVITLPIGIALWTVVGIVGSNIMGCHYAFIWPIMETFRAISKEGFENKFVGVFTDGTWTNFWNACTIVRDFADFSFHSYFSVMDEWLEAKKDEKIIELNILQVPGCILSAIVGVLVDVPIITMIVIYKAPIMLVKGWQRLLEDLIGRSGPFLETVCVPFAGLLILLWPFAVILAVLAGIISSFGFGGYAAIVAYQNSTKKGLLYVVAGIALFDESTNDFLYLREGSCFPRPWYREVDDLSSPLLPVKGLHDHLEFVHGRKPLMRSTSEKQQSALKAVMIWDSFIKKCELTGKELLANGAIGTNDLEAWQHSKNKIVNNGISAYSFLQCFLISIKSGSPGFLLRDNIEITNVNRPEGRIFDWLFEPMIIMKEQIKSLHLLETEELYLCKLALYCGDTQRIDAWKNGGIPPYDEIRRAQLEGISRRLHGFCLTLSRLPTFRRRFNKVVKALMKEAMQQSSGYGYGSESSIETLV
ncbi:hypothetical protein GIB67_019532 [Kingdonia uniflora]|uniref:Transmembrane protein n=1 Tax=Kingdonia uniflora TaxID=39325 RepID=A0A7J7N0R7_9MAGN|nr:hypothetical protein GIB67_019532 [Kingdonia uniflora]